MITGHFSVQKLAKAAARADWHSDGELLISKSELWFVTTICDTYKRRSRVSANAMCVVKRWEAPTRSHP